MNNQGQVVVDWAGGSTADSAGIYMQQFTISFVGLDSPAGDTFYAKGPGGRSFPTRTSTRSAPVSRPDDAVDRSPSPGPPGVAPTCEVEHRPGGRGGHPDEASLERCREPLPRPGPSAGEGGKAEALLRRAPAARQSRPESNTSLRFSRAGFIEDRLSPDLVRTSRGVGHPWWPNDRQRTFSTT